MTANSPLELASLLTRHPRGEYLLYVFGSSALHRLRVDPTQQLSGVTSREVEVDFVCRPGTDRSVEVRRTVGWSAIPPLLEELSTQAPGRVNEHRISEDAAIAVMALLMSDLENEKLSNVLQIGEGPDYVVSCETEGTTWVEVSGIRQVDQAWQSEGRRREKTEQLLKDRDSGHVSVTTFARGRARIVHSFLHFVWRSEGGKAQYRSS